MFVDNVGICAGIWSRTVIVYLYFCTQPIWSEFYWLPETRNRNHSNFKLRREAPTLYFYAVGWLTNFHLRRDAYLRVGPFSPRVGCRWCRVRRLSRPARAVARPLSCWTHLKQKRNEKVVSQRKRTAANIIKRVIFKVCAKGVVYLIVYFCKR